MHCVEIVKIVSSGDLPCVNNPEISRPGLEAVSKAPGCLRMFMGQEEEDPPNIFLINVWESLHHHETFMADSQKYATAQEGLTLVMKEFIYLIHVYFTTKPCKALRAPLTEVAIFTLKEGVLREKFVGVLATLVTAMNSIPESLGACGGASWGPVVENNKQYVLVGGWKDMESWENVPNLPGSTELFAQLREYAELDVKHVRLSQFKTSTNLKKETEEIL